MSSSGRTEGAWKILHVCDTAGVASLLSRFMDSGFHTKSRVINRKALDTFGFTEGAWDCGVYEFGARALVEARKHDVVWIHSWDNALGALRRACPGRLFIMHYHGDDIRVPGWEARRSRWSKADLVFVATDDLSRLPAAPNPTVLPTPVDTDLFRPSVNPRGRPSAALHILTGQPGEDLEAVRANAKSLGLDLEVRDRRALPVHYREMPALLRSYPYYVDRTYIKALSKTALEALACGLTVIRWDGEEVGGLPAEHRPESSAALAWKAISERLSRR